MHQHGTAGSSAWRSNKLQLGRSEAKQRVWHANTMVSLVTRRHVDLGVWLVARKLAQLQLLLRLLLLLGLLHLLLLRGEVEGKAWLALCLLR